MPDPVPTPAEMVRDLREAAGHSAAQAGHLPEHFRHKTLEWAAADMIERMAAALTRLRDCDWTITPLDRMDAVRDIAAAALEEKDERPHA